MAGDPDRVDLEAVLGRARARMRAAQALRCAVLAALGVHAVLAPWLVLKSLWPIGVFEYAAAVVGAAVLGAVGGWLRPRSVRAAARVLDERLGLDERLTTALELGARPGLRLAGALAADAAAHARRLAPAAAIPLAAPAGPTRAAIAAAAVSALLLWLPPIPFATPAAARAAPADAASEAAAPLAGIAPEAPAAPPRDPGPPAAAREVRFRETPIHPEPAAFERLLRTDDERLGLLGSVERLPSLQVGDDPGTALASFAEAAATPPAAGLEVRRYSSAEAAEALGALESLWGNARPNDAHELPPSSDLRDQPEEGGPSRQPPEGGDLVNREPTENEPPEAMPLNPDEERLTPPSDRFASLPEDMDLAASDLPPWPKDGPGEGIEDDRKRDDEGTGRNAGEPGTGFSTPLRGAVAERIDSDDAPEIDLAGQQQAGKRHSFETELTGLTAPGRAQRPTRMMRARFTRRAEQSLSEGWIPLEARAAVKRYFEAIQARQ